MGECERCGQRFEGKQRTARYCTNFCRQKHYDARNGERVRWARILRLYGLTRDEWESLLADQGGLCPVCEAPPVDAVADHDHNTGKIRGILCRNCNAGIGLLCDDPEFALNAHDYLRGFHGRTYGR